MEIKLQKLNPEAKMPARATQGAAGADLCACLPQGPMRFAPMQRALVPTGLSMELPGPGHVALVFARSGLALKQGLAMANGVGVVDSDYRGELCVPMVNLSQEDVEVQHGERVAQLVIMPVETPVFCEAEALSETGRGAGGFGSTGRR